MIKKAARITTESHELDENAGMDSILELATTVEGGGPEEVSLPQKNESNGGDAFVVNFADFTPVKLVFHVENLTTKMAVKKGSPITLSEFKERGFILELPERSCAKGHHLLVDVSTSGKPGTQIKLEMTGKVENVEVLGEGVCTVDVTLLQFDESKWQELRDYYFNRQNEILDFFTAARGY
jgi:hypothetical protein